MITLVNYGLIGLPNGSCRLASDPGEPGTGLPRLSVTDEEGTLLAELAEGRTVLEIGTGLGVSTCYLASNAERVISVDIDSWVHQTIWPTLKHLDNVTLLAGIPDGILVDMVFIDACHQMDAVKRDIETALKMLESDGLLVLHDVNYGNVLDGVKAAGLLDRMVIHRTTHGIGVVVCG